MNPAAWKRLYASQINCMSPYSMPLCTILTKWPAPPGPMCVTQGVPSTLAAMASKIGRMIRHDSAGPPGMIDGPLSAPSSPPETPVPMNRRFLAASCWSRRSVSVNSELPPSMIRSPGSTNGTSCSITASTGAPALTMIMILRGRASDSTNSARVLVATSLRPALAATNSSVVDVVRL